MLTAHLGEMGSGVLADPNMEYGDDYGDYEGYDGMDASYDGGILDTSGLTVGAQDGNKGNTYLTLSNTILYPCIQTQDDAKSLIDIFGICL